jgi:hypothetical protein
LGPDPSWRYEIMLARVGPFFGKSKSRRFQLLHEVVDGIANAEPLRDRFASFRVP